MTGRRSRAARKSPRSRAPGARASACGCRRSWRWSLNGQPIVNDGGGPFVVAGEDVRYPTIVTDEVLRPATLTVGAHTVRYLHRRPRPPPSNDQPMPYVREDIAGLVLETARQALTLADAAGLPRDVPVTLVEAPLRHELVQRHGDVDPGVRPGVSHLSLRSPAQVPPHGDRARDPRGGRRRRGARLRIPDRPRPHGGRAGRLPGRRVRARRIPAAGILPRAAVADRFRARGRPAAVRAAPRVGVDLLRRRRRPRPDRATASIGSRSSAPARGCSTTSFWIWSARRASRCWRASCTPIASRCAAPPPRCSARTWAGSGRSGWCACRPSTTGWRRCGSRRAPAADRT